MNSVQRYTRHETPVMGCSLELKMCVISFHRTALRNERSNCAGLLIAPSSLYLRVCSPPSSSSESVDNLSTLHGWPQHQCNPISRVRLLPSSLGDCNIIRMRALPAAAHTAASRSLDPNTHTATTFQYYTRDAAYTLHAAPLATTARSIDRSYERAAAYMLSGVHLRDRRATDSVGRSVVVAESRDAQRSAGCLVARFRSGASREQLRSGVHFVRSSSFRSVCVRRRERVFF